MDIEQSTGLTPPPDWERDFQSISPEIALLTGSPSYFLMKVLHTWQKKIRERLIDFDLTNTQFTMLTSLLILNRGRKPVIQADLAGFLSADKMMVSEVLRTLEKKGYIIRQDHPTDKRAKSLAVTEKGIEIIDVAAKEAVMFDREFFSVIGEDREALIRILKKLM